MIPLGTILVTLIVVGVLLYLVNAFVPMEARVKQILNIVVILIVLLWLVKAFGLLSWLNNVKV